MKEERFIVTKNQLRRIVRKAFDVGTAGKLVAAIRPEFDPISFAGEARLSPKMASLMIAINGNKTPSNQEIEQAKNEFAKYLDNKISKLKDASTKLNGALSVLPEGSSLMADTKLLAMKSNNQAADCQTVKSKVMPLFDSLLK